MQIVETMRTEPLHISWLFGYAITIGLVSLLAKCLRFKIGCQKNIILNRGTKDSANVMPVRISHSGRIIIAFRQWLQRSDIIPFPHLETYFAVCFIIITGWTWLIHRLAKYIQLNFPYLVFRFPTPVYFNYTPLPTCLNLESKSKRKPSWQPRQLNRVII